MAFSSSDSKLSMLEKHINSIYWYVFEFGVKKKKISAGKGTIFPFEWIAHNKKNASPKQNICC